MKEKLMKKKALVGFLAAAVVLICSAALVFALKKDDNAYRSIKIVESDGKVEIERKDSEAIQASANMNLQSGDRITTDNDSFAVLCLDEDKFVRLNSDSTIVVEATGKEESGKTRIVLEEGGVLNEIQNPLEENSSYEIKTPNATMSVRGTVYEVRLEEIEEEDCTSVLVYDGKVEVAVEGLESDIYTEGEYTQFTNSDKPEFIVKKSKITMDVMDSKMLEWLDDISESGRMTFFEELTEDNSDNDNATDKPKSTVDSKTTPSASETPSVIAAADSNTPKPESEKDNKPKATKAAEKKDKQQNNTPNDKQDIETTDSPVKPEEPKATESVTIPEPSKTAGAVEEPKKTEPVKKTEAPEKTETVKKTEAPEKTEPVKKTEPPKTTKPVIKTEPPKTTEPVIKTEPPKTTEPVKKTEPPKTTEPVIETSKPSATPGITTEEPGATEDVVVTDKPIVTDEPQKTADPEKTPSGTTPKPDKPEKTFTVTYYLPYIAESYYMNQGDAYQHAAIKDIKPEVYLKEKVEKGSLLVAPTEPECSDKSMSFAGWYCENGKLFDYTTEVKSNLKLYPVWKDSEGAMYYPVIYRSSETDLELCNCVKEGSIGYETPTRFGYDLVGWEKPDGSLWGNYTEKVDGFEVLNAVWHKWSFMSNKVVFKTSTGDIVDVKFVVAGTKCDAPSRPLSDGIDLPEEAKDGKEIKDWINNNKSYKDTIIMYGMEFIAVWENN